MHAISNLRTVVLRSSTHTQPSIGHVTIYRTYFERQSTGMWEVLIQGLVQAFYSAEFFIIPKLWNAFKCKLYDVSLLWNTMTLSQVSESRFRKFWIQSRSESILVLCTFVNIAKLYTIFLAVYATHVILWLEKLSRQNKSRSECKFTMQIFLVSYSCFKKNIQDWTACP